MKTKERVGINVLKRVKTDYVFRTFIFSALSFFITLTFTCYNIFLGIVYKTTWNIGIAVYYALLLHIRAYVIFSERKFHKRKLTYAQIAVKRRQLFLVQSVFLFIIDFALIAPISLMIMQKKPGNYSAIPAIAVAAYTTYKLVASTRNIIKTKKESNLSIIILRKVSFVDALVSILTLQYTLIITFGGGKEEHDTSVLCAASSIVIWILLILLSLKTLLQSIKIKYN